MTQPRNLTPAEWSNVLQSDVPAGVAKVADELRDGYRVPWAEVVLRNTEDASNTLDMGSGRGEMSAMLAKRGKHVTLIDWSEKNLEFSRGLFGAMGLQGTHRRVDMTKTLPFGDETFDFVFSCGVFEYFTNEQIRSILKEAFRVARLRVMILVPNAWSLPYRFGKWYLELRKRWNWGGERPIGTLKPYFRAATRGRIREFSVATNRSLDFLEMPGGRLLRGIAGKIFRLKDHPRPSFLNQGYLLITVGEKVCDVR